MYCLNVVVMSWILLVKCVVEPRMTFLSKLWIDGPRTIQDDGTSTRYAWTSTDSLLWMGDCELDVTQD
jgi:hypothetical protein